MGSLRHDRLDSVSRRARVLNAVAGIVVAGACVFGASVAMPVSAGAVELSGGVTVTPDTAFEPAIDTSQAPAPAVSAVPTAQPVASPSGGAPESGHSLGQTETASVLSASLAPTLDASPSVRVEEDHPFLVYTGRWHADSGAAASSGGYRYSSTAGSTLRIEFEGTGVSVIGPVGPTYGEFEVWLNDERVDTVSQYAPRYAHQQVLWEWRDLADGAHTLVLRVKGTREPGSTGTLVIVDAFDVVGDVTRVEQWPPPGRVAFEESDPRAFREGRWTRTRTSAASGGAVMHTGVVGSLFTVHFSGTRIAWIGPRAPGYGRAEVFVDGVRRATISQYAPTVSHRQVIWSVDGLEPGRHTLTIRVLGTRVAASAGTVIAVDGFVADELLVPRFEEGDRGVQRSGSWICGTSTLASGGGYLYSRQPDAYVVVPFWGSSFRWIGMRGPAFGMAEVHLDGRLAGTVDLFAPEVQTGQTLWSVSGLSDGYHAVVIRVLGRGSPGSTGATVVLDGFEFQGAGARPAGWAPGRVRIEEADGRLAGAGGWSAGSAAGASGGTYRYASRPGASITVTFIGTSVSWIGPTGPSYGRAAVFLNGVRVATVSQYAHDFAHQRVVWALSGLPDRAHTLAVRATATKEDSSTGTALVVDGFDVTGAATQRLEETDRASSRGAGWSAGSAAGASGGTYRYASRPGASITVTFIGTSVSWIGPTGPSYGRAAVFLNGVRVATVSQYARDFAHQRVVWALSGLPDRAHTLAIQTLGTREAASTGSVVVVDGFDVAGERATSRGLVVALARQQLGKQYVWAAEGPDTFDCSGLVVYVFRNAIGVSVPRTSRQQWAASGPRFATFTHLMPGDLAFSTSPTNIHHVGIYVGFGLTIHAPRTGRFVEYRTAHTYGVFGRLAPSVWPLHRRG